MKTLLILLFCVFTCPAWADDPTQLHFMTGLPGSLEHSAVVEGHAYCSTSSGLLVLDVSLPTKITQVALLPLPGWGRGIAVESGYAYLLVWDVGLVVINIQDPTAPTVAAILPEPDRPSEIVLSGHHAFISDMGLGLCVVDILDPTQPQLAATHPLSGELYGIDVEGNVVYVAANHEDLHLLDVSTPEKPALISSVSLAGQVRDVAVRDGLAYLACGFYGLRIFDVTDPATPLQVAQRNMVFDLGFSVWTNAVSLAGDRACMGLSYYGLGLVDISDPTAPADEVRQEIRGTTAASTIPNDMAFVAASHGGLVAVDISVPATPQTANQFWLLGMVTDLEAADGKIWVAGGYSPPDEKSLRTHDAGLFVVDLTALTSPRVVGYCSTGLEPSRLALSGHHAFLSTGFAGIRIQDIADPTAPVEVGSLPTTTESYAHDVQGDFAYTFLGGRFMVMDVSDPSLPVEAGSCDVDYHGHLTVEGATAFNTIGSQGLQVFDVGDPDQPMAMAWLDLPSGAQESALSGDHLYVANGLNGLSVVKVSDPSQPELVGSCDLPGYVFSVACRGPFAYLVTDDFWEERGQLLVVDISHPDSPMLIDGVDLPAEAQSVAVDGSLVFVGCRGAGALVFRHDATSSAAVPLAPARLRNHPNPFNPRTVITYEVTAGTHVTLAVFDLAGRLVRTLVDEVKTAGRHEVPWEGIDNQGRSVSSGVYLARMNAGEHQFSRAMVLIR